MLIRNSIIAIGLCSLIAMAAYADPIYDWGSVTPPTAIGFSGAAPSGVAISSLGGGTGLSVNSGFGFSHTFSFTLPGGSAGNTLFSIAISIVCRGAFTDFSIYLSGGNGQGIWGSTSYSNGIATGGGLGGSLSAGSYSFTISGTGPAGASYLGLASFSNTGTVPTAEPSSLLLLGIGFSALGLVYRLKKK